jgi:chromosome segregation ATPase
LALITQDSKNLRDKLSETESALRQRRLEAEQTSAELANTKTALAESANALASSRAENQSMLIALEQLKAQLKEAEKISTELNASKSALAESANALAASRAENQSMLSALHHLKGQLEEAEQTRKELSSLKDTAREEVAKSTDRTQEIATLTAILRQSEDKMAVSETALNAVLRGLLQLLNKQPSRLLPRSLQIRQRARVLRESGLFDPDWYLAENEDVAKAGIDPLLHYVEFGANENRAPNAFLARLGTCNVFELQHPDKTKH